MSSARRVAKGSAANALGVLLNAVIQVFSIPVMISQWGPEGFATWVILATIPSYIALSDFGFLQAATSDMTMRHARLDRAGVNRVFGATWGGLLLGCTIVLGLALSVFFLDQWGRVPLPELIRTQAVSILLLVVFACLSLLSRVSLAALRATGHYATGTASFDLLVFAENLALLGAVAAGGGFVAAALGLTLFRCFNLLLLYCQQRRLTPWLRRKPTLSGLRDLLWPALAAMSIPAAIALTQQGSVIIAASVISPLAVAVLTPVRTASRLILQIAATINRASMPEFARGFCQKDLATRSGLIRVNIALGFGFLVPAGLLFAATGPDLVRLWTGKKIAPDPIFVAAMALAAVLHGLWYFGANMLLSTNHHTRLAPTLVAAAGLTLALVWGGAVLSGLTGLGLGLAVGEALCLVLTAQVLLRHRHGTPGPATGDIL